MRRLYLALLLALTASTALAGEFRILALGDSLTEGYGVAQTQAYPALLEAELHRRGFTEAKVINAGIGGSTSASAVARIRWQLRAKPQVVLLALGANDMLRGIPAKDCEANLDAALELLSLEKIPVILAGMRVPPNYGARYRIDFEAIFPRLARKHGVTLIPFLLEGVAGLRDFNQEDGIHPNEKGHARMAALVLKPVLKTLTQALKKEHP